VIELNELKSCCFTGHRPDKLPWGRNESSPDCLYFKRVLTDALDSLYDSGYRHFICGMAQGTDMYFGEAVLALRQLHPDVTLEAAIPFPDQAAHWSRPMRERYDRLLQAADQQKVICPHYAPYCMMARNRYMVDKADLLIAAYNGTPGGTQKTIAYACRKRRHIMQLPISVEKSDEPS
jgi:uncharacterized phage-like protein YoqJ